MTGTVRPLHVVESWPPVLTGYTQRSAALVRAQTARGDLAPRVLVTSRQGTYGQGPAEPTTGQDPAMLRQAPTSAREQRRRRVRGPAVDGTALRAQVREAVDELGADLVHVHWSSTIGAAAAAAARDRGLPLVAEVRFDLAGAVTSQTARVPVGRARLEHRLRGVFERHLAGAQAVVAASPSLAELLGRELPALAGRISVAANGCEPGRFSPGPRDPVLVERYGLADRPVIGSTSTMLRYEGLDLLLAAAARLAPEHPGLTVLLVGDGPERPRLIAQARDLGVRLVAPGRVPPADVAAHYRLFDVFVVPRRDVTVTRYAGPLKLVEALAAGCACVVADVGDNGWLVGSGRGSMVPPADPAALVREVGRLLGDSAARERLSAAGSRWARTAATWDAAVTVHRAAYDEVLSCPSPALRR